MSKSYTYLFHQMNEKRDPVNPANILLKTVNDILAGIPGYPGIHCKFFIVYFIQHFLVALSQQ